MSCSSWVLLAWVVPLRVELAFFPLQRINTWAYLGRWSPEIHAEFPTRHRVCLRAVLLAAVRGRRQDGAAAVSQATLGATPFELWVLIFQHLGSLDYVLR